MNLTDSAKELVSREHIKITKMNDTIVMNDGTNLVSIPGFPYKFKAQGDKILVSVDVFKTGLECKLCKGKKRIKARCSCEEHDRPGYKYSSTQLADFGKDISIAPKELMKCTNCNGDYLLKRVDIECPDCEGKGHILHIPDSAKTRPTTGVIVSVGNDVKNTDLKNGVRVLFGQYSGQMIPTQAGVSFMTLREHEIHLTIYGGEDMAAFDFVSIDKEME